MRDTTSWYQTLVDQLKQDRDVVQRWAEKERGRIAKLIVHVELGLFLLLEVAPTQPATEVRHLISGYRFPAIGNKWLTCKIARFYLLEYKGSNWEDSLDEYIKDIPDDLKAFDLADAEQIPTSREHLYYRHRVYRHVLQTSPAVKQHQVKLARQEGRWLAEIEGKEEPVAITLPQAVLNLPRSPIVPFVRTRSKSNPPYTFTLKSLLLSAKEMDRRLARSNIYLNYYERFRDIVLSIYNHSLNDFSEDTIFTLDQLNHIVGLLNVGKSTFIDVVSFNLVSRGRNAKRCALMVGDVVSQVRKASLFKHLLGIPAAPILGQNRVEHLEKINKSILQSTGSDVEQGAISPVREWFNESCPLLYHVQGDNIWNFGEEPGHKKLYQKEPNAKKKSNVKSTCPYYYTCPRHQIERDIANGLVWVLTPESFVHTEVHRSVSLDNIHFAEFVARECEFLFVDEADLMKGRLAKVFAPDANLIAKDGLINQTGIDISKFNDSHRPQTKYKSWEKFTACYNLIELTIPPLYRQLNNNPLLVKWLGKITFHSYGVFSRIVQELLDCSGITDKNLFRAIFDELKLFIDNPLDRRKGGELANIARELILLGASDLALDDLRFWCSDWLDKKGLSSPNNSLDELIEKFRFGILLAILSHHLQKLVDNKVAYLELQAFDNNAFPLILRPPQEYLAMIPESPVGNLLGFLYYPNKEGGGILKYFRYLGVGESLLLNFDKLLEVDGWDSAHTVLVSGTSYAPGSSAFHIPIRPSLLLKSKSSTDPILQGRFVFSPQLNGSKYITISGVPQHKVEMAYREMAKAITGVYPNFLDDRYEELKELAQDDPALWSDRERILGVTGSYDQAEWIIQELRSRYLVGDLNEIQPLRRDADNRVHWYPGLKRGEFEKVAESIIQLLVGPLGAMERGHNALNDEKKAAFGTILFIKRPMPVPHDWFEVVQGLNSWALQQFEPHQQIYQYSSLQTQGDYFARAAWIELMKLTSKTVYFSDLKREERLTLCANQVVSIWQVIGRGVRGNVPINVHWLDKSFAPQSADNKQDDETTSLLVAIIKTLEFWMSSDIPWEATIARELWGIFLHLLKETDFLVYDK